VEWNGRTLTGPELLDTVRREWLAEMPELARITAYAALMLPPGSTENIGVSANEVLIGPTREYSKFMPDMIKALAAVIDRDAADCPVDDVPALYAAYLRSVAGIAAELPDHAGPLEKPLDLLARRNETFYNEQVLKYRAITTPMLEFRQTWALAVYRENASEMRSISEVFRGAFLEDAKLGDGFVRKANSSAGYFSTLDPVLPTLRRRGQRPLQQPAIFNRVVADKATPDLLFAPLEEGCVALLAAPTSTAAIQKQLAALRRDLLVDEKNPPLTLPAALAIWKAEQGFWNAAGADIESYHVDTSHSLLVRVAYDEPNFAHLDRLPLPGDLGQLFLRVRCSPPYWLYHDHFFCDLYTE
jgi:hypothetical protein